MFINIENLRQSLDSLTTPLTSFSFPKVAARLAALLTQSDYHVVTDRIEELIHIAAIACRGNDTPTTRQLETWLSTLIQQNPNLELGVPFEDVFVSNVVYSFGNARLFNGTWQNNSDYVQVCISTLNNLANERWAFEALSNVTSLLQISDAVAERVGVSRNSDSNVLTPNDFEDFESIINRANEYLIFSKKDLESIGVNPQNLEPFVFQTEHVGSLFDQTIGHSTLERRPLVRFEGQTIVVLPTAIGATIRRYILECASATGQIQRFQSEYLNIQFTELFHSARTGWEVEFVEFMHQPGSSLRDFVGTFDVGSYVYVLFIPDSFQEIAEAGLTSVHTLETKVADRINEQLLTLSNKSDFQRGLTILVHGGIGRVFSPIVAVNPSGWHPICLTQTDFMLLGCKDDFSALRAWKLLQQVEDLSQAGVTVVSDRGFMNLFAVSCYSQYELVPKHFASGEIYLGNDFLLSLRIEIRKSRDKHASISPDGKAWFTVECVNPSEFIPKKPELQVFTSVQSWIDREILSCVETQTRPWWILCRDWPQTEWRRAVVWNVLIMGLKWLGRMAPTLEETIISKDQSDPVTFEFEFPNIENFNQTGTSIDEIPSAPKVSTHNSTIVIECSPGYLSGFLRTDNLNDQYLVAAFARGVFQLYGRTMTSSNEIEKIVQMTIGSDKARYFQMHPCNTPEDLIFDASSLPPSRLLMPEDQAWARLNLARRAGCESSSTHIPPYEACRLLEKAVDCIWGRVRARLRNLSRESVIKSSILNYIAIQKEHRDWYRTSAAQLALYDKTDVENALIYQESRRDRTGVACRIVAEMALCTSPYGTATACTNVDIDYLVAEVATLLECASYRDALNHPSNATPLYIHANGSFEFDESSLKQIANSSISEHIQTKFLNAQFWRDEEPKEIFNMEVLDRDFETAFVAEFGLRIEQYQKFVYELTRELLSAREPLASIRKNELELRLKKFGNANTRRFFKSLVLMPRKHWDENEPNGENRDWYPWRFYRRLSLLRRPIVQLSLEENPLFLVAPSLLARTLEYLRTATLGQLPPALFDSDEMATFIGHASNQIGHEFNQIVERKIRDLGWETKLEINLTQIGGAANLGDIDVLAWNPDDGLVFVVECKCLRIDRTYREVAERLSEYIDGTVDGNRTQLRKHLDRIDFLKCNVTQLSKFIELQEKPLKIRSVLITQNITPLKFFDALKDKIDFVSNYGELEQVFGKL